MTLPAPPPGWKPWHRWNQYLRTGYQTENRVAYVFPLPDGRFLLRVYQRHGGPSELYYLAHFNHIEVAFAAAATMMEENEHDR